MQVALRNVLYMVLLFKKRLQKTVKPLKIKNEILNSIFNSNYNYSCEN